MNDFRIFVLGAGFSSRAGLPLAQPLWQEVMIRAKRLRWIVKELDNELAEFSRFRRSRGDDIDSNPIDFEDFFAYLDVEHALGLKGCDQFSSEGNRLQLVLKWLIAQVIVERTPYASDLPSCYIEFAKILQPHDLVITFNYDTILENSLDFIKKPYRLIPFVSNEGSDDFSTNDENNLIILKLHGSIDWFDKTRYNQIDESYKRNGNNAPPDDIIFGPKSSLRSVPLANKTEFPNDPLANVYRIIKGLRKLYTLEPILLESPLILAPSNMKILYSERLKSVFWGLGREGGWSLGLIIIGYSIPQHDDYVRQIIMRITSNYQRLWWNENIFEMKKNPVLLIDLRNNSESIEKYKLSYSFSEPEKTKYHFSGFDSKAIELIKESS